MLSARERVGRETSERRHAMSGDIAEEADRESGAFIAVRVASICSQAERADDETAKPAKPGETRLCSRCEEKISPKRLEARPRTTLCKDCKENEES
jgi:DnaK suppressor protein